MVDPSNQRKCIAVVRIRGTVSGSMQVRETLEMLHLSRNNYSVLIDSRPSFMGMLNAARDYITYGEPSEEIVELMIREKGRMQGNKKLTDDDARKFGFRNVKELVNAVHGCRVEYWHLPNVQPVFRMHPPTKGYKGSIKKSYGAHGELGYRGEKINELLKRLL